MYIDLPKCIISSEYNSGEYEFTKYVYSVKNYSPSYIHNSVQSFVTVRETDVPSSKVSVNVSV